MQFVFARKRIHNGLRRLQPQAGVQFLMAYNYNTFHTVKYYKNETNSIAQCYFNTKTYKGVGNVLFSYPHCEVYKTTIKKM